MFRNIKLGTKMIGGFGVVLVLLLVTAYVGYNGLTNVKNRSDNTDEVNLIVNYIFEARGNEKNFLLERDKAYATKVDQKLKEIIEQVNATKTKFYKEVDKERMDAVISHVGAYEKAFIEYVSLFEQKNQAMEKMRAKAAIALEHAEAISEDQKKHLTEERMKYAERISRTEQAQLARFVSDNEAILSDRLTKVNETALMIRWFLDARKNEKEFILSGEEKWKINVENDIDKILNLAETLKQSPTEDIHRQIFEKMISAIKDYQSSFGRFCDMTAQQVEAGKITETAAREAQKACAEAVDDQRANLVWHMVKANRTMLVTTILALLLGLLCAFFISNSITSPLKKAVEAARQVASGDLTVKVPYSDSGDELGVLGEALNMMIRNLGRQITEIKEGANVLVSSTSEILVSITQFTSSATEMGTAVDETASTVEEVKQTAHLSNEKADNVVAVSKDTEQISRKGRKATEDTIAEINRVKEQMDAIAESIVRLSEQSQAVGEIIATVDDLADQSNLLAVNASIEAVKAGEYGKSFGVVAQEIRGLAEQSKQSTKAIRGILNDIQRAVSRAVMVTEQGSKAVDAGVRQSAQAGEAIPVLANNIEEAAKAAVQIAVSSQQQLAGLDQVAMAMESIRQASSQNVSGSKQIENATRDLEELGRKLMELVERYQV